MKFTIVAFVFFCAAIQSALPVGCEPKPGDSAAQVLRSCGEPVARDSIRTSYGALREEWEWPELFVLLEDGVVLHAVKLEQPVIRKPAQGAL